jgi:ABC-2 type transport system ATP-binding protein
MLQLQAVSKSFGNRRAVDGLSLHIHRGEVLGLLGPNGAGKTTTISLATGLIAPDEGKVLIGDESLGMPPADPRLPAARRLIGVAPQGLAIYETLSAIENLRFFGGLHGLRGDLLRQSIERALVMVGLSDRARDQARTYSGGMKRRLSLAAAMIHQPKLIFLDEPTAGVDPQSRSALLELIRTLRDQGTTIVYSTHYMEEAERLCDRVAIIDQGKLLALDTVPGLLAHHGGESLVEFVRTSADGRTSVERHTTKDPVHTLNHAAGLGAISSARVKGPDLESVFLSLTGRTLRD